MKYLGTLLGLLYIFQQEPAAIIEIRKQFIYVNDNLSKMEKRKFEVMDQSTEGGEGIQYFDEGELVKLSFKLYGESGKLTRDIYFKNQELIFVYDQKSIYNRSIYLDDTTAKETGLITSFSPNKTNIMEDRFYFDDQRLIRWIDSDGSHRHQGDSAFSNVERAIIDDVEHLLQKPLR